MKINYENLSKIVVKSQDELDLTPLDFKGKIYIEFGTYYNKAIVKNNYYNSVVARGNSSVVARENSSVVAWGNSSVVARENSQIVDMLQNAKIKISGNSRIVYMPKNIFEFMDFYGIKHGKKKAIFYKAVRKISGRYIANYNNCFEYIIGEIKTEKVDYDVTNNCGIGIHISHLDWALDFGSNWDNLAILEVEVDIDKIILPELSDGNVRTNEVKVIREIPLEYCGAYGKILNKKINKK